MPLIPLEILSLASDTFIPLFLSLSEAVLGILFVSVLMKWDHTQTERCCLVPFGGEAGL